MDVPQPPLPLDPPPADFPLNELPPLPPSPQCEDDAIAVNTPGVAVEPKGPFSSSNKQLSDRKTMPSKKRKGFVKDVENPKCPSSGQPPMKHAKRDVGLSEKESSNKIPTEGNDVDPLQFGGDNADFRVIDDLEGVEDEQEEVDSDDSWVPEEEEVEALLEEGVKDYKEKNPSDKVAPIEKEKVILDNKVDDPFDILPEGWIVVTHDSGMPIYLHRISRVVCVSRPYCLGRASARRHDIPISAIPCLAYKKALKEEEEKEAKRSSLQKNSSENASNSNNDLYEPLLNKKPSTVKTSKAICSEILQSVVESAVDTNKPLSIVIDEVSEVNEADLDMLNKSGDSACQLGNDIYQEMGKGLINSDDFMEQCMSAISADDNIDTDDVLQKVMELNKFCDEAYSKPKCQPKESNSQKKMDNFSPEIDLTTVLGSVDEDLEIDRSCMITDNVDVSSNLVNEVCENVDKDNKLRIVSKQENVIGQQVDGKPVCSQPKVESNSHNSIEKPECSPNTKGKSQNNTKPSNSEQDTQNPEIEMKVKPLDGFGHMNPLPENDPAVLSSKNVQIKTTDQYESERTIDASDMYKYCANLFKFKTIKIKKFVSWKDRRMHHKTQMMRERKKAMTLPVNTTLIACPTPLQNEAIAKDLNYQDTKKIREVILNPMGKSDVCLLHEYVQNALRVQPKFEFAEIENAATPYSATVVIGSTKYGTAYGSSKKIAKAAASKLTLEILLPEVLKMRAKEEQDADEKDMAFFDDVKIDDPRVTDLCQKSGQPTPFAILEECVKRNFGLKDMKIQMEMKTFQHQRSEFCMTVGKHEAKVLAKNKREGKQRASQQILKLLHPHIHCWGSLLRLYSNTKAFRQKKAEEQSITSLQTQAAQPNKAILEKLKVEMMKLHNKRAAMEVRMKGKFEVQTTGFKFTEPNMLDA